MFTDDDLRWSRRGYNGSCEVMHICPYCSALVNHKLKHAMWHIRTDMPDGLPVVYEVGKRKISGYWWEESQRELFDYVEIHHWLEDEVVDLLEREKTKEDSTFIRNGGYFMIEYIN